MGETSGLGRRSARLRKMPLLRYSQGTHGGDARDSGSAGCQRGSPARGQVIGHTPPPYELGSPFRLA
jgi:hypothetical protein